MNSSMQARASARDSERPALVGRRKLLRDASRMAIRPVGVSIGKRPVVTVLRDPKSAATLVSTLKMVDTWKSRRTANVLAR